MIPKFVNSTFLDDNRIPHVEVSNLLRNETYPVYSEEVRNLITNEIYAERGKPPTKAEKELIQDILAAEAFASGRMKSVPLRTALTEEGIELDLNDELGNCVLINADGWTITRPKSLFYRPNSSRSLPIPIRGATWELFKKHFNTKTEDDLVLLMSFMISAMRPMNPHAVLVLQGEQGSAKSTTARKIKSLIDPSKGATRGILKKEQDVFIAAKCNHLLSFDNISQISNELSDTLCRISSKGSFSARSLYTNDSEFLIELCRPILLNGITEFVTRSDLSSRSIIIELAKISETERKTEAQIMTAFEADTPAMLGVLLDGMSAALRNFDSVQLENLPRIADVAIWSTAGEQGLGIPNGSFVKALEKNQLNSSLSQLSNDPVAIAMRSLMVNLSKRQWSGTATDLLRELSQHKPYMEGNGSWPANPSYLSGYLTRLAPSLRKVGIDIGHERTANQRTVVITKLDNFNDMNQARALTGDAIQNVTNATLHRVMFDDDDGWTEIQ